MPAQDASTTRRRGDFAFALAPDAHAPERARRELETRLPGGLPAEVVDNAMLLTTELVTNGVRHSPAGDAGTVDVAVTLAPKQIRVEVSDPGSGFDHTPHRPGTLSEGGRGLFLVEVIADRWGMGAEKRTTVWYELDMGRERETAGSAHEQSAGTGAAAMAASEQASGNPGPSVVQVSVEAGELAADLRELGADNGSLEHQARDIETDLARMAESLRAGAEALRARRKLADAHTEAPEGG
jgi:anti-sigma regulatory factor (Ser/Thr protein kinase)